jgi:hypothetical protein
LCKQFEPSSSHYDPSLLACVIFFFAEGRNSLHKPLDLRLHRALCCIAWAGFSLLGDESGACQHCPAAYQGDGSMQCCFCAPKLTTSSPGKRFANALKFCV